MELEEIISSLSIRPWDSKDLETLKSLLNTVRLRYSGEKIWIPDAVGSRRNSILLITPLEERLRSSHFATPAAGLLDVFTAHSESLDITYVSDYLKLLEGVKQSRFKIVDTYYDGKPYNLLLFEDKETDYILPIFLDNLWSFAVVYSDCIHWFSFSLHSPSPRVLFEISGREMQTWRPGKSFKRYTDVLVLRGIHRIISNLTVPSLENVTDEILETLRNEVFVQLACGKLDVTEEDIQSCVNPHQDSFGEMLEDMQQQDIENVWERDSSSPPLFLSATPSFTTGYRSSSIGPKASANQHQMNQVRSPAALRDFERLERKMSGAQRGEAVGLGKNDSYSPQSDIDDDRVIIMKNLQEAIVQYRSTRLGKSGPRDVYMLETLCRVIRRKELGSFFRRYSSVLFYEKTKGTTLSSRRRKLRDACRDWFELCEIFNSWGDKKYTVLCVLPSNAQAKDIRALKARLKVTAARSKVETYLWHASNLCEALINQQIPQTQLPIEVDLELHRLSHDDDSLDQYFKQAVGLTGEIEASELRLDDTSSF